MMPSIALIAILGSVGEASKLNSYILQTVRAKLGCYLNYRNSIVRHFYNSIRIKELFEKEKAIKTFSVEASFVSNKWLVTYLET